MGRSISILIVFGIVLVIIVFVALAFGSVPADSHSWYPSECCSDQDCKPAPCEQIKILDNGCREYDGATYCDQKQFPQMKRIRPSQDEQCHACRVPGNSFGICIFVLPGENS